MGDKITISPGFCFLWALCLLILPLRWATGAFLAALVHEAAHWCAVYLLGGQVFSINLRGHGAVMEASPMTSGKEALCALAGPAGSFLLVLLAEYFPEAAVCALVQGCYNLLPIYPLDGGRIIRCLFPDAVYRALEAFFLVLLVGFSMWLSIYHINLGILLLLIGSFPLIRGKIACKESNLAVQ